MAVPASPRPAAAASRARLRRRLRAIPSPLAALLVAVAVFGVSWALVDPAYQAPDEDVHFAYVQSLVERHARPGTGPQPVSTAQRGSMTATNTDAVATFTIAVPEWGPAAYRRWLGRTGGESQSDGGGYNAASGYPPAYYLAETPAYALAGPHANVLTRLYAVRLGSVVWLLLTTIGVWLLAGELTGRRRDLQLVAAAVVGLWPMLDFMSASANPDALLYTSWTWSLWLGVRVLRHGLTLRAGALFVACVLLALATKATSLALLPAAAFVVLFGLWRRLPRRRATGVVFALAVVLGPLVVWRFGTHLSGQAAFVNSANSSNLREFASYLWQFYLPRLPFQQHLTFVVPTVSTYPAFGVWVASGWAAFGWVMVFFPKSVYAGFLAVTVLLGGAAVVRGALLLARHRGAPALRGVWLPVAVFLALAAFFLVLGLHYTEYKLRSPTLQGRYLFPIAGLGGLAVALATTALPARVRPLGQGAVLAGLILLQLGCLGLVASHFYG